MRLESTFPQELKRLRKNTEGRAGVGKQHPSGAKARFDSIAVMYGLKPVPFGGSGGGR